MDSTPEALTAVWLGVQPFAATLERQLAARDALIAGEGPPTIFLVEHPATLTLGRRGSRADILWSEEALAAARVDVCESPRGGQVTLHAPGQLVAYPVVFVGRRIRDHLNHLAEAARLLLAEMGVVGPEFRMDHPGLWLGEKKLASIGIHVSRGVTVQGIAINLAVEATLFSALVSCGLRDVEMTSAAALGGRESTVEAAARRYAALFAAQRGATLRWG
ncbi:MAG: lipoyl(octanoyl) transferase LipB [Nannocystis sp.]|nr:lipoyl(octanoyl) transferase LipB [Nannocystis sp.]